MREDKAEELSRKLAELAAEFTKVCLEDKTPMIYIRSGGAVVTFVISGRTAVMTMGFGQAVSDFDTACPECDVNG